LMQGGQGAAGALAGYQSAAATRRGDTMFGTRQMMANNMINYQNARGQSQTQGANNILAGGTALVSAIAGAATGMPMGSMGGGSAGGLSGLAGGSAGGLSSLFGNNFSFGG
ncbi:MAG: hypothetical protein AAGJ53_05080, partial [Pseudomonadota bacterium]